MMRALRRLVSSSPNDSTPYFRGRGFFGLRRHRDTSTAQEPGSVPQTNTSVVDPSQLLEVATRPTEPDAPSSSECPICGAGVSAAALSVPTEAYNRPPQLCIECLRRGLATWNRWSWAAQEVTDGYDRLVIQNPFRVDTLELSTAVPNTNPAPPEVVATRTLHAALPITPRRPRRPRQIPLEVANPAPRPVSQILDTISDSRTEAPPPTQNAMSAPLSSRRRAFSSTSRVATSSNTARHSHYAPISSTEDASGAYVSGHAYERPRPMAMHSLSAPTNSTPYTTAPPPPTLTSARRPRQAPPEVANLVPRPLSQISDTGAISDPRPAAPPPTRNTTSAFSSPRSRPPPSVEATRYVHPRYYSGYSLATHMRVLPAHNAPRVFYVDPVEVRRQQRELDLAAYEQQVAYERRRRSRSHLRVHFES